MTRAPVEAWAGDLLRPAPLVAAAVLGINDHVLKGADVLPAAITGKLSDVAGLFVAGVVAVCLLRGAVVTLTGRLPARTGRVGKTALVGVAVFFGALKLWPAFNHALAFWGHNTLDPTDLYAIPVLALVALWLRDRDHAFDTARAFPTGVALAAMLLLCGATPKQRTPPKPPRPYAGWIVSDTEFALPCGQAKAWVSKSGKTGFALVVRVVASEGAPCPATVVLARLLIGGNPVPGATVDLGEHPLPPEAPAAVVGDEGEVAPEPAPRDSPPPRLGHFFYVTFAFDNNAAWNSGTRTGDIELYIEVAGTRVPWHMDGVHRFRFLGEKS